MLALLLFCGFLIRKLSLPMPYHKDSTTVDSKYKHRKTA